MLTQVWRVKLILVNLPQNESKGGYHHCIYLNIAPSQSQNATYYFYLINQKCLPSQTIACFQANFFNLPQEPFSLPLDPVIQMEINQQIPERRTPANRILAFSLDFFQIKSSSKYLKLLQFCIFFESVPDQANNHTGLFSQRISKSSHLR